MYSLDEMCVSPPAYSMTEAEAVLVTPAPVAESLNLYVRFFDPAFAGTPNGNDALPWVQLVVAGRPGRDGVAVTVQLVALATDAARVRSPPGVGSELALAANEVTVGATWAATVTFTALVLAVPEPEAVMANVYFTALVEGAAGSDTVTEAVPVEQDLV